MRFWEVQEGEDNSVAGKIKHHADYWENEIKACPFVLDIVKNGYKLDFTSEPPMYFAENNKSSFRHKKFVETSIEDLLKNNCIKELDYAPHCVNPLTVADKSKLRLVIDLRHVNNYEVKKKFKYENLKTVSELFEQDDHFVTFDLKSGYHHIPIHESHQKYLGFSWVFNGRRRFFQFKVLPFGLSSACFVFTKVLRQLVKRWRSLGIKSILYLDDGIVGDKSFLSTVRIRNIVLKDLFLSGLTVNFKKSHLIPTTSCKWLGFIVDTRKMMFFIPKEKVEELLLNIQNTLTSGYCSARQIAKITGHIVSMSIAIGPLTKLFTKQMHKFIESRYSWDALRLRSHDITVELLFWKSNLQKCNGLQIKHNPMITKIIYSDASGTGYGGFLIQKLDIEVAQGNFTTDEISTSSTNRELLAVKFILQSFSHILSNETVQWFTDNINVTRIIQSGSTKQHLQKIAIEIYNICIINNIILYPAWVPREYNTIADSISKQHDSDNWSIDPETFSYIKSVYGHFTADRFSDDLNKKVEKFNSKVFCPNTAAVNAFSCNWENDFNWLCPPIYLIGKTIRHLKNCKGKGVLFVPMWKSSYFWPMLTCDGVSFNSFIKHFLLLDPYFINNTFCQSVFDGFANFYSLALLVDFTGN